MSAFQLPALHIAAILGTAYRQTRSSSPTPLEKLEQMAKILADENARSVGHRYNEENDSDVPTGAQITLFINRPLSVAEAFMALDSFEYQSCECDDWATTAAHGICIEARKKLSRQVPGYDEATTWCLDKTPAELEAAKRAAFRKSQACAS